MREDRLGAEAGRAAGEAAGEGTGAYTYLAALFSGLLVIANVIAVKPVPLFGQVVPAAVLAYALTFPITDTVSEVWGPARARRLVWAGMLTSVVVAALIRIALWLPALPGWGANEAFAAVLGQNLRIVAASMVAYLASQFHDVWAFEFWRRRTAGRHLWWRNTASTLVSQLIDTSLFITIAFLGVWGGWDVVAQAVVGQYVIKAAIALLDTPLVYAAVRWARGERRA